MLSKEQMKGKGRKLEMDFANGRDQEIECREELC